LAERTKFKERIHWITARVSGSTCEERRGWQGRLPHGSWNHPVIKWPEGTVHLNKTVLPSVALEWWFQSVWNSFSNEIFCGIAIYRIGTKRFRASETCE
jgi:hypothetical protein